MTWLRLYGAIFGNHNGTKGSMENQGIWELDLLLCSTASQLRHHRSLFLGRLFSGIGIGKPKIRYTGYRKRLRYAAASKAVNKCIQLRIQTLPISSRRFDFHSFPFCFPWSDWFRWWSRAGLQLHPLIAGSTSNGRTFPIIIVW